MCDDDLDGERLVFKMRSAIAFVGVLAALALTSHAPVNAVGATLSFPCHFVQKTVVCTLSGQHFHPREAVHIIYMVRASPALGAPVTATYRRLAVTDIHGSFTRPPFWTSFDPCQGFSIDITVKGMYGDRAMTAAGGGS